MSLKRSTMALSHAFGLKKKITPPVKRTALAHKIRAEKKVVGRKRMVKKLTDNAHYDQSKLHKMRTGDYSKNQRGANW